MTYEEVAALAGTVGLIFFIVMFAAVLVYALWPGNKSKFDEAARRPLKED
jgi:cytochrome c oxidase cbb3-type subunit 4